MPNKITISFIPCTPTPPGGYDLYYKIKGSTSDYIYGGNFTESPAAVVVGGAPGVLYEGYLQSKCLTVNGAAVPWVMLTPGTNNAEFAESDSLAAACEMNAYKTLFFTGTVDTGTVLYTDLTLQTKYTAHPFLKTHSGVIYSVNQGTGQITLAGAC